MKHAVECLINRDLSSSLALEPEKNKNNWMEKENSLILWHSLNYFIPPSTVTVAIRDPC